MLIDFWGGFAKPCNRRNIVPPARCSKEDGNNTWTDHSEHRAIVLRTTEANLMNKLLLTLGLVCLTLANGQAQGTIQFVNGVLTRVERVDPTGGANFAMDIPFNVAVYFADTPGAWQGPVLPLGRSIGTSGLFTAPTPYLIPGAEPLQTVDMLIYAWTAQFGDDPYQAWMAGAWTASTSVRQVTLGETAGPGTVIWGSGTNPNRLFPLIFNVGNPPPPVVPEPSTLALGALGGLLLLFRCRRSARK